MENIKIPVSIDIILLGESSNYGIELKYLSDIKTKGKSGIFKIIGIKEVHLTEPDELWGYSQTKLLELVSDHLNTQNITLCFIDCPLEGNYFRKKLSDHAAIVTFFQAREICEEANVSIKSYILRHLYKTAVRTLLNNDKGNKEITLSHDRTKGCLYDFCGYDKYHVVLGYNKICPACEDKLRKANLPNGFVDLLIAELSNIAQDDKAIYIDDEVIMQKLNTLPEHKMAEDVFVPLLKKSGLNGVKFTGGTGERGIDIEYYEISQPEGDKQFVGIQFKKGDITYSSGGAKGSIAEIKNQSIEAFEKPISDINAGATVYIHRFVVATTGDINENARRIIGEASYRGDNLNRHIKYWDKRMLASLVRKHWQEEFIAYFDM